jgi:L-alanine-DL-glutamate epimerase-like enolase superfamily enzyme
MKVGRPRLAEDVERVRAMRAHLGDGFPLMADANMKWSVDEAIRAARGARPLRSHLARGAHHSRRSRGPCRIVREGGLPVAAGENLRSVWEFKLYIAGAA